MGLAPLEEANEQMVLNGHASPGGGICTTVIVTEALETPEALEAEMVTVLFPKLAVMPVINPVAAFKFKPDGRPMAAKPVGLLSAVIW
jgi:hypothetical protein